jgi:anthranilate synthase component 2
VANEAEVTVPDERLFAGLPSRFQVGRYHSWAVRPASIPDDLEVTARDANGEVLAFRHRQYDVRGVQFHPESILTEHGAQMLANWLA